MSFLPARIFRKKWYFTNAERRISPVAKSCRVSRYQDWEVTQMLANAMVIR